MRKTMNATNYAALTEVSPGILLLGVSGTAADPTVCEHFELAISKALASRCRVIVVDLSEANSVSTVVLGLLLKLRRGAAAQGGEVRLSGVQPMVRRVLNICRLDQLFPLFSSPESAMESGATARAI